MPPLPLRGNFTRFSGESSGGGVSEIQRGNFPWFLGEISGVGVLEVLDCQERRVFSLDVEDIIHFSSSTNPNGHGDQLSLEFRVLI